MLAVTAGLALPRLSAAEDRAPPNPADAALSPFFPSALETSHTRAWVTLACQKDAAGAPRDCQVQRQDTPAPDVAQAALRIVQSPEAQAAHPIHDAPGPITVFFLVDPPRVLVFDHPPTIITNPDWLQRPTGDQLAAFYPRAALRRRISGFVRMRCAVTRSGTLADCAVEVADPPDQGFEAAALRLAPYFLMRPLTRDGVAIDGGRVVLPIRFAIPGR